VLFWDLVKTYSVEDRVQTLEVAKEAGMDLWAGVILGMDETPTDHTENLDDILQRALDEINEFFVGYKNYKKARSRNIGWEDRQGALNVIEHATVPYEKQFG